MSAAKSEKLEDAPEVSDVQTTGSVEGPLEITADEKEISRPKDARFWLIIVTLSVTAILAAIDATIITTALPRIVSALSGGEKYVWVVGSYFLSSTALQPMYGQTANIFGRRGLMIFSTVIFTLGSGICGGAKDMNMLIAGRTVQGIGGGGINMLVELIVCDIVPLRERGSYTAIIFSASIIGSAMGPFIGGIITQRSSWRWCFYINLPIGGLALVMLVFLLNVGHRKLSTKEMLRRVDFIGNFIFVGAVLGFMFGLINGGVKYSWGSWHIVVPLVLSGVGLILFALFEHSPYCIEPTMPRQLFSNRTSVAALFLTFIHMALMTWVTYFLAVYFQAVRRDSPTASGVDLLPTVLGFTPAAAVAGALLAKHGIYRPYHLAGFAIMTIGMGLYSILTPTTITAGWILIQILYAIGCGIVMPSLLPAMQADLSDLDTATATATLAFARSVGTIFGSVIPSIIFNNRFDHLAGHISDATIRNMLIGGEAYSHATNTFINSLTGTTRTEVIWTYNEAIKMVWYVAIAFCGLGFLVVFVEKEIKLRTELDTEFGIVEQERSQPDH
ncbi:major facilitator superfamily domain-containing protein [Xylogone sp. PMI_703]|nr:major facilitator superfamily domain-containing protein [Xylogone sp. PMI_703]